MKIKFKYIMLFLALLVAGCAGYFSVWGLSQLFAGASTAIITMATGLEIAKIASTTALHRYWFKISHVLKVYLTIAVAVLMLITSAGIYGFLSNAYQKTANKLEIHQGEVSVFNGKKTLFDKNIIDNEKIITTKNRRIDQLTEIRNKQETRLDSAKTNRSKDKVRDDITSATLEIQKLSNEIDLFNIKNTSLSDSISKYNTKILELQAGSEIAAEIGPLKYISELTGASMAKVVNFLILLLIFVFDPLAIALVLMTNRIFEIEGDTNPLGPKDKTDDTVNEGVNEGVNEVVNEGVNEVVIVEEPIVKNEPVKLTGKIEIQDIKEIKEGNRGYSVTIPKSTNTIERIGTNKVVKNGDNNKLFFRRS